MTGRPRKYEKPVTMTVWLESWVVKSIDKLRKGHRGVSRGDVVTDAMRALLESQEADREPR